MFSRNPVLAWIGIMVFSGVFLTLLMGQDCAAQGDVCDPDPCQGIQNAVPDTCTAIAGVCGAANDFTCECATPFTWQETTNTCETLCVDNDEDDSYAIDSVDCPQGDDCDDNNADVYPGALELCDGIDNQCPGDVGYGDVDEGCERLVFITESMIYVLNLGGIAGADAICQAQANAAGLPGTYKAWLSDSTTSPNNSFVKSSYPYILVNGTSIANDWNDLTDGSILAAINLTAQGIQVGGYPVWTNTDVDGTPAAWGSCGDWTSNIGTGGIGLSGTVDSHWTNHGQLTCHHMIGGGGYGALYCFQQ